MIPSKHFSNAEKLMAVVDTWAKPLVNHLPAPYSYIAPAIAPLVANLLKMVPDESIPKVANNIIDNAVAQGKLSIWNMNFDSDELIELQRLIRLNIPCDKQHEQEYDVIIS